MIEVDEEVLVQYIEDTLWCFDSYGYYYYSNTKWHFLELLEKNILGLSEGNLKKLKIAINERLEKIKSEWVTPNELSRESK